MSWIDYGKVRAGVMIESVLSHYRIETRKISDAQLKADCPLPSHTSKEHPKGTFSVSLAKQKWYCHSDTCRVASGMPQGGDSIDLVRLLEGCTVLDAAKRLIEWFPDLGTNSNGTTKLPDEPTHKKDEGKTSLFFGNPPLKFTLKDVNPVHPMIQGKNISVETAATFNVGFFPGRGSMQNRIVFPLYENGHLIGYAGRTVTEITPRNPKWRLPAALKFTFVYGLERCDPAKMLILCESPWGVLHFFQKGIQAAAIIGTHLTEAQEKLLVPFSTICVAMDNDAAGRQAGEKIAKRLKERGHKVWKATLLE
jgi:hypothetical protein